jgi:hypothetical protein
MPSARLTFLSEGGWPTWPPRLDALGPSRCQAGLDPTLDRVALELGQAGHDGAHPARGAEIEAEPRLSPDANFPAVQIVELLNEVLSVPAPSAEFGNQDSVDLAASSQRQNLGTLGARIVSA